MQPHCACKLAIHYGAVLDVCHASTEQNICSSRATACMSVILLSQYYKIWFISQLGSATSTVLFWVFKKKIAVYVYVYGYT